MRRAVATFLFIVLLQAASFAQDHTVIALAPMTTPFTN